MSERQKVVIVGHSYTSRMGLIRSIAPFDCEITVVAMVFRNKTERIIRLNAGKPIDCYSKYVSRVLFCLADTEKRLIDLLIKRCSHKGQKVILIPDSDFAAAAIDNHQDQLKEFFLFPHIHHSAGEVVKWMNKERQKQLAESIGLNVVKGQVVGVQNGSYSFPDDVSYPCFTKPLATINGGKQFLRRCEKKEDLRRVLDAVSKKYNTDVLIEDYKTIEKEYAVVGFSDGDTVSIPGVIEFIVNSRSHMGIAREGKIRPVDGFENLIGQFKDYVRQIGFCGLFDIDFFECNGLYYFDEMNLRYGGSGYAYTVMGANLPSMLVRHFQNPDWKNIVEDVSKSASFVNERMCMDDYLHGYLNEKQVKEIINRSDIRFIIDQEDAAPFRKMKREFALLKMKRIRLRLKRMMKK